MSEEQQENINILNKLVDVEISLATSNSTVEKFICKNAYVYEQTISSDGSPQFGAVVTHLDKMYMRYGLAKTAIKAVVDDTPTQEQLDFLLGDDVGSGNEAGRLIHNNYSNITLGSDPEIFAIDKKGIVIPAFEFCYAKSEIEQEARRRYTHLINTSSIISNVYTRCIPFWDGFQAEWMTAAHRCLEGVTQDVATGIYYTYQKLMEKYPHGKLVSDNLVEIPEHMLLAAAEEHVQFGCSPSKNAYNALPLVVANGREVGVRAAGVHIHFGIGGTPNKTELVRLLDASMGLASVAMFGKEEDPRRREMYGRAGEYREPKHGLEYRVLSSAVLQHPYRFHLMVDMGRYVMRLAMAKVLHLKEFVFDSQLTQAVINSGDIEGARELLTKNEKFWVTFFQDSYGHVKPWDWLMKGHRKSGTIYDNWRVEENQGYGVGADCCVRNAV